MEELDRLGLTEAQKKSVEELFAVLLEGKKTRIEKAREMYDWLESFLNSPNPLIMSPIFGWLDGGADFEMDVKPVAMAWKKKNPTKNIYSLTWLTELVMKSVDQRKNNPNPLPGETFEQYLARRKL